jgi:DNA-binding XRE family transcriptional regulator
MLVLDYHDRDRTENTNVMQHTGLITYVTSFAQRLKEARRKLGLSQAALGAKAEMSQGAIANFEAGIREQPRNLLALAKALDVDPNWLESGKSPQNSDESKGEPGQPLSGSNSTTSAFTFDGRDPMQSLPTIGMTIAHLGALLAALTPMGRKSIAPLLASIADEPEVASNAARVADAIAASQRIDMRNTDLARSISSGHENPVETSPAPLEDLPPGWGAF